MRSKNSYEQDWKYLDPSTNTVKTECAKNYDICTYFPVGFVPFIEKDMYDIMIEIPDSTSAGISEEMILDFHVAYVTLAYTNQ